VNVAIIPARGGSKRIPRKNIRPFLGKPIIAYSIEAARDAGMFDRIIVSTDDPEIAEVANAHGAETPFLRPADISDDQTDTAAVVKHTLEWLRTSGASAQYACCIYATAPFVRATDLQEGFNQLAASSKAFAFSVTSFPFPIQRALKLIGDGVTPFAPEHAETRSQDLEEAYHDAGQFYWGRAAAFLAGLPLFAPSSIPIVLPRHRVQDIDTEEDWVRAEHLFRAIQASEANP
jgi:pseudaminic acid cytidylyltransferase